MSENRMSIMMYAGTSTGDAQLVIRNNGDLPSGLRELNLCLTGQVHSNLLNIGGLLKVELNPSR